MYAEKLSAEKFQNYVSKHEPKNWEEALLGKNADTGIEIVRIGERFQKANPNMSVKKALQLSSLELRGTDKTTLDSGLRMVREYIPRKPKKEKFADPREKRTPLQQLIDELRDGITGIGRLPFSPVVFAAAFIRADKIIEQDASTVNLHMVWEEEILNFYNANRSKKVTSFREWATEFVLGGTGSLDKRLFHETWTNAAVSEKVALVALLGFMARVEFGKNLDRASGVTRTSLSSVL